MGKVAGVAAVRVSLNEGLTALDLKPANTVKLVQLRQVIRNNGFVTNEAQVTARGIVSAEKDRLLFEISESGERLALNPGSGQAGAIDELRARLKASNRADVVLSGKVDLTNPNALTLSVTSVQVP